MKIQVVSDRRLNQGFGLLCSLPLSLLLGVGAAVSAASTGAEVMESSAMAVRPFPLCATIISVFAGKIGHAAQRSNGPATNDGTACADFAEGP